jgi:DNA-directed RNA polymerase subunit RPC12/RpoP
MIVREMKCGMCGRRFEVEVLDRDDPKEKHVPGYPVRCPNCNSTLVEKVRDLRRVTRRAS